MESNINVFDTVTGKTFVFKSHEDKNNFLILGMNWLLMYWREKMNFKKIILLTLFFTLIYVILVRAEEVQYTKKEICSAIYIIEGGENTNYPYGIKSVKCNSKEECKQICYNTIENNRKRYADYGHKKYDTYLEFLGSIYCPEEELCKNWLPNLKFYLEKE